MSGEAIIASLVVKVEPTSAFPYGMYRQEHVEKIMPVKQEVRQNVEREQLL